MLLLADLSDASQYALDNEIEWSRDTSHPWGIHLEDPEPWNILLGPVKPRGGVAGVVNLSGERVESFGDIDRADLTFSVAKTYLALIAGVAYDDGLIVDIDEKISNKLPGIGFDSPHNQDITWRQLLQQTSEWSGECVGIPDQVDHHRILSFQDRPAERRPKGTLRSLNYPGSYWEYNDVRINQLSLALLHLFQRELPDVFRERILEPLGASSNWSWDPYDGAEVDTSSGRLKTVPGGSHWGGGVSISTKDQALIGELIKREGVVNGRSVISSEWIREMRAPCPIAPFYGLLTWLNTERRLFKSLPETSVFAIGAGGAYTWIDSVLDLVVVVRWISPNAAETYFSKILNCLN